MKCTFCGSEVHAGKGKMFVKNSGLVFTFCGGKCQRNFRLGRDGKRLKWTERSAALKNKQ